MEPAVLYFHRKAWQRALREDLLLHLAEDIAGDQDSVGRMSVAVLFADLANFLPMTEAMGDTAAAQVIERFSDLVREAAGECDGRVLKQIGDEVMLVFPSGMQAVRCGRSIMAKAAAEEQFPDVRLGAHYGDAMYREGDYLGTTVNVAARVASQATRGQFLVTDAVRRELHAEDGVESVGVQTLKGVSEAVELFEVASARVARPVDPVCGMVIDPEACLVTVEWHDDRVFFCSEACRDRFVAEPDRFVHPT
ncbi:MAG: YHS domain-containing protein [Actinomycetota bacterium]|nr:YHS domain-containing protein [Actinomycetota bacterium]